MKCLFPLHFCQYFALQQTVSFWYAIQNDQEFWTAHSTECHFRKANSQPRGITDWRDRTLSIFATERQKLETIPDTSMTAQFTRVTMATKSLGWSRSSAIRMVHGQARSHHASRRLLMPSRGTTVGSLRISQMPSTMAPVNRWDREENGLWKIYWKVTEKKLPALLFKSHGWNIVNTMRWNKG